MKQNFLTSIENFDQLNSLNLDDLFSNELNQSSQIEELYFVEKRLRNFTYNHLDFLNHSTSYFQYYSKDVFLSVLYAKACASFLKEEIAGSELLFLYFLRHKSTVYAILKKNNLNISTFGRWLNHNYSIGEKFYENSWYPFIRLQFFLLESFYTLEELLLPITILLNLVLNPVISQINEKIFQKIDKTFLQELKQIFRKDNSKEEISPNWAFMTHTEESKLIFEKATENAKYRFKTPLVSSEIFLITMIEEKQTRIGRILRHFFKNEIDLNLLRYELIKSIHSNESQIRNEISSNQKYFAYLLAGSLSDLDWKYLGKSRIDTLSEQIEDFRDEIVEEITQKNFHNEIMKEIQTSIKNNSNRKYRKIRKKQYKKK